jgi:nanoRNase/pAp phosphatase (c-di-AMP/oligoRNAs hydrolase)
MIATRTKRSDALLAALSDFSNVVVLTHDNPDPDAIASGWAVYTLIKELQHKNVKLIGGGAIVRAENLHMVRLLSPPLELQDSFDDEGAAVILVDSVPTAANHLLEDRPMRALAVIDHHQLHGNSFRARFRDIRPRLAATATITAGYLREQGLEPDVPLATALLYAIRTELTRERSSLSRTDRSIITWLSHFADHATINAVENAPLSRAYFADLLLALETTFLYDNAALCFLPRASGAEIVGEVADLIIRLEGVERVLCGAVVGDAVVLSSRTTAEGGDGCALLRRTVRSLGHCGGHRHRAGGKIELQPGSGNLDDLQRTLRERWLSACGADQERGTRLVPRREILDHL